MQLVIQKKIILIFCFVCIGFISNPYFFGHANHGQELPPILALLDKDLFLNDFSVQSYLDINPRYFWQLLIAGAIELFGISIAQSLAFILFFSSLSLFSAIYFLSEIFIGKTRITQLYSRDLLRCFCFISLLAMMPLLSWGSKIFYFDAIPSTLGMGIAIWALYFSLRERWVTAYIFCGVSIFIHFLVGLFAGLVILPAFVIHLFRNKNLIKFLFSLAIWLTPAFYIYLNMLALETETVYDYKLFEVFGMYRVPHHWVPSTGGPIRWASDLLLLLIGLYCLIILAREKFNTHILQLLTSVLAVSLLGLSINYIFVEVFNSEFIGKLQFQRIMPFGHLAIFALISIYLFNPMSMSSSKRMISALILIYPIFTIAIVNIRNQFETLLAFTAIGTSALIYLIFSLCRQNKNSFYEMGTFFFLGLLTFSLYIKPEFLDVIDKNISSKIMHQYRIQEDKTNQSIIAKWLKNNTGKHELILIPPMGHSFLSKMQLQSQRAVYFSHKNVPYSKNAIFEWAHRLEKLINRNIEAHLKSSDIFEAWKNNSAQNIETVAMQNNICFIIDVDLAQHNFSGKIVLQEEANNFVYLLWKLDHCKLDQLINQ